MSESNQKRSGNGGWRLYAVSLAAMAASLAAQPAAAQTGSLFGNGELDGIRVVRGKNAPVTLIDLPGALSQQGLCGWILDQRSDVQQQVSPVLTAFAQDWVSRHVNGFGVNRGELALSTRCSRQLEPVIIQNDRARELVVKINLTNNRYTGSITTPSPEVLGVPVGPGRGLDPRISIHFDMALRLRIALPQSPGGQFGPISARATIDNFAMPRGENPTGDVLELVADVARELDAAFNDGEMARMMADGFQMGGRVGAIDLARLNRALESAGASQLESGPVDGALQFTLHSGERYVDAGCIPGYVWRVIRPDDLVCVSPSTRAQARFDEAQAADRRVSNPRPNPACVTYGAGGCRLNFAIACKPGWVWREAVAEDYVCVTPEVRAQARDDNQMAQRLRKDYVPPSPR